MSHYRLCFTLSFTLLSLSSLHTISFLLRHSNFLGRRCSAPPPPPLLPFPPLNIAIVSLSEESTESRISSFRSFVGVKEIVWENKKRYAEMMGYGFVDGTELVDISRPPNWSKILVVRDGLRNYDWVFWNDADTVITNMGISLESILFGLIGHNDFNSAPDLIITEDFNGVNSGAFFMGRSNWSSKFLEQWWNQTSYIRFNSTKSGDNAAMKYLINNLSKEEFNNHVIVSKMQCLFNSYPWFPSWKSLYRLVFSPLTTWKGVYSDGDFMVHLAGLDDKRGWALKIIQEMKNSEMKSLKQCSA
ncbi:hypothetical protein LUZ60_002368 [Juncus effusus]|nr:hypothetical protein LUZ60_002368 [Juncus effusus]